MAPLLCAKFCLSDSSAYFPSKDASLSLSCGRHDDIFSDGNLIRRARPAFAECLTFCSMMSRLFFSLWKSSLSCWDCKVICEDCFFRVASLSWEEGRKRQSVTWNWWRAVWRGSVKQFLFEIRAPLLFPNCFYTIFVCPPSSVKFTDQIHL